MWRWTLSKVSLFASAVRPRLWPSLFKSLEGTLNGFDLEVVFSGPLKSGLDVPELPLGVIFNFIKTENIKPAQCYEIARRNCTGEVVVWVADDCEFPNDVIGKAYAYWKSKNNEKLILSIQTKESGYKNPQGSLFDMNIHRLFGGDINSPLMAPLGMMSRKFLDELGGIDRRYVCGQYENDIVMRAYSKGATVEVFGGPECYIDIDHLGKSIAIGESTNEDNFRDRPFAKGYEQDRKILENSWCRFNQYKLETLVRSGQRAAYPSEMYDIFPTQLDQFQPYPENISLTKSEEPKGAWE